MSQYLLCTTFSGSFYSKTQNSIRNIHKNIEEYNPNKKREIISDFDEMIGDIPKNKKMDATVTELVIRVGNWNFFFCLYYRILFCITKKY